MQSDGNSFGGDVVFDTYNKASRDEDNILYQMYSVTQSYANSFLEYVVLDTSDNVYRDEDNILDQIYIKQNVRIFIMMIFDFHNIIQKCILTLNYHYNPIL